MAKMIEISPGQLVAYDFANTQIKARADSGELKVVDNGQQVSETPTPQIAGGLASPTQNAGPGTNLVSYKDALEQVVQLARQARNEGVQGFMNQAGFQGTMKASDFNTLFDQANRIGTKVENSALDKLSKDQPKFEQRQLGSDLYQYQVDSSGKIIGEPTKVLSGKDGPSDPSKLSAVERQQLLGSGLSSEDIDAIEKDVQDGNIDNVLAGLEDKDQRDAVLKAYGQEPKITREFVDADMTPKMAYDQLKEKFTTKELKVMADVATDEGVRSRYLTGGVADVERYLNSEEARQKAIDLTYAKYKAAGQTE